MQTVAALSLIGLLPLEEPETDEPENGAEPERID